MKSIQQQANRFDDGEIMSEYCGKIEQIVGASVLCYHIRMDLEDLEVKQQVLEESCLILRFVS